MPTNEDSKQRRLRVLLITARADHGGGPRHVLDLLRAFQGRDIDFYIGSPDEEPYADQFVRLTKKFFEIPPRSFSPFAFIRLRRVVKRAKIDVIHSHGRGAGVYSRLLGLLTGCRVLHTFHGIHREKSFAGRVKLLVDQIFAFFPFTPIYVSENERSEALQYHCVRPNSDGHVIENAVDTSRFPPRVTPAFAGTALHFGGFTRTELTKGPDLFLRLANACAHLGQWSLAGISREELAPYGVIPPTLQVLDRIREPATWLQSLDVFVSTARNEGLPLGVLEAMAAGCVCVLNDIPAHRVFADSGAALLFEADVPKSFDTVIERLMNDHALRGLLLENSQREVHKRYSLEAFRQKIERAYQATDTN